MKRCKNKNETFELAQNNYLLLIVSANRKNKLQRTIYKGLYSTQNSTKKIIPLF